MKKGDIINGQFILSDYKHPRKTIGIIQNVQNAIESGRRTPGNDKDELCYDIFFPETGITDNVCEHSGVTSEAVVISKEKAEIFLLERINKIEKKILALRAKNFVIRNLFSEIFKKQPMA